VSILEIQNKIYKIAANHQVVRALICSIFLIHSSVKLDGNESLFAESDITYLNFTPQKCENKFAAAIKHHNRTRLVIQFAVSESDEICVTI
jgi:hypothetical protein